MSDGDLGRQVWQMRKFLAFTIAAMRRGGSQYDFSRELNDPG